MVFIRDALAYAISVLLQHRLFNLSNKPTESAHPHSYTRVLAARSQCMIVDEGPGQ